jgi:hypothetical protein
MEVYVWEPQSTNTVKIADYPNADSIFFVGGEKTEAKAKD